ncbi:hypothetical protein [Pseudomonas sp. LRF_L74]|uniref:hypothetical protein n=1 Tax=Pseudomonas sp. LRF_L74 TaxID=3369422 RepID=UPI003F644D4A
MSKNHPFYSGTYSGHDCYCMTVEDRVQRVAEFDLAACDAALQIEGLQATVRKAIERRIKRLEAAQKNELPSSPPAYHLNEI